MASFAGRVAIITGSTQGIGRAAATLLAQRGCRVVIHGTNQQRLNDTLEVLKKAEIPGMRIQHHLGDIREVEVQQRLIDLAVQSFGQLDILINNAGVLMAPGETDFCTMSGFKTTMGINLEAAYGLTQKAVPELAKTRGNIVNISSLVGSRTNATAPAYEMSKAGLEQLTRYMAVRYGMDHGIRANAVAPYVTVTEIFRSINVPADEVVSTFESTAARIPLRRVAEPQEVAETIAFMASDRASYVNGQVLMVDGGASAGWTFQE